jgi:hypothetical protein
MENIYIQFQDIGGWRTSVVMPATSSSQRILIEMQGVQRMYPDYRVRAADENGRMIDKL